MGKKKMQCSFEALIYKVQTLRGGDGSYRLTLDVPLIYAKEMAKLLSADQESIIAVGIVEKPREVIGKQEPERKVVTTRSPLVGE